MATVGHINAIVVPISTVHHIQVGQREVLTALKGEPPTGTAPEVQTVYTHIVALIEEKQAGTGVRTLTTHVVDRVNKFPCMMQAVNGKCQLQSLPVDGALPTQAYMIYLASSNQGIGGHLVRIVGNRDSIGQRIMSRVSATQ